MRSVFGLVLVVGLALAGFAVYMVKDYFEQQQMMVAAERAAAAQNVPTVDVVAIKEGVLYGQTLTPEDVVMIRYAEPYLPEGVFRSFEDLFGDEPDQQRIVLRPMEALEPVLSAKVTEPGGNAGITSLLKPGMRAFAIRVDVASGVSGFLRPGDRVDVYWTGRAALGGGSLGTSEVTKLIQSGIAIVAVDQNTDNTRNQAIVARTITVEASPQQVAALAQAQATGWLTLSLVGTFHTVVADAAEVDQATLLGIEEQVAEAAPEPEPEEKICTIRTRKGADVVEIVIPCSDG